MTLRPSSYLASANDAIASLSGLLVVMQIKFTRSLVSVGAAMFNTTSSAMNAASSRTTVPVAVVAPVPRSVAALDGYACTMFSWPSRVTYTKSSLLAVFTLPPNRTLSTLEMSMINFSIIFDTRDDVE